MQNYIYDPELSKTENRLLEIAALMNCQMRSETFFNIYIEKFGRGIDQKTIEKTLRRLADVGEIKINLIKNCIVFG